MMAVSRARQRSWVTGVFRLAPAHFPTRWDVGTFGYNGRVLLSRCGVAFGMRNRKMTKRGAVGDEFGGSAEKPACFVVPAPWLGGELRAYRGIQAVREVRR